LLPYPQKIHRKTGAHPVLDDKPRIIGISVFGDIRQRDVILLSWICWTRTVSVRTLISLLAVMIGPSWLLKHFRHNLNLRIHFGGRFERSRSRYFPPSSRIRGKEATNHFRDATNMILFAFLRLSRVSRFILGRPPLDELKDHVDLRRAEHAANPLPGMVVNGALTRSFFTSCAFPAGWRRAAPAYSSHFDTPSIGWHI